MKPALLFLMLPFLGLGKGFVDNDSIQKTNPILFGEGYFGIGAGNSFGFLWGANFNFQHKKDLFTFRYVGYSGSENNKVRTRTIAHIMIFPSIVNVEKTSGFSLLYGKRHIKNKTSYSYSIGLGMVSQDRRKYNSTINEYGNWENNTYLGFPFELNYKWFKAKKQRFRAYYGLIPIGKKKVAFGRSIGFKLYGDISKNSHLGIGITYGFGTHKEYTD